MKKILMMAFVSMALLATVSCSKDKEEDEKTVSLVGTRWVGTQTFSNIPLIGSIAVTADLRFNSETKCVTDITLTPQIPGVDLPTGEFDYTFDGKRYVKIVTGSSLVGDLELEYEGNTMIFKLPSIISSYTGGVTQFILNKRS